MSGTTYTLTEEQVRWLLDNTIALFLEYRNEGADTPSAQADAVNEAMEALNIDREMARVYGDAPVLQTIVEATL